MRKFYSILLAALIAPFFASAETVTFDLTSLELDNMAGVTPQTIEPITLRFQAGNNFRGPFYRDNLVVISAGNNIVVETAEGIITSVALNLAAAADDVDFTTDAGSIVYNADELAWNVSESNKNKVTVTNASNWQCELKTIVVEYDANAVLETTKVADFQEALQAEGLVEFTCPLTVIAAIESQYGGPMGGNSPTSLYVKAGNTYGLIVGTIAGDDGRKLSNLQNGTLLAAGAVVERSESWDGSIQFAPIKGFAKDGTTEPVEPKVVTEYETVVAYGVNCYVRLEKTYFDAYMGEAKLYGGTLSVEPFDYNIRPEGSGPYNIVGFLAPQVWGDNEFVIKATEFIYASNVAIPTTNIDPWATYIDQVEVELLADEGAQIYYTLDGTDPTEESTLYTGPFVVDESCYLTAIAYLNGEASGILSVSIRVEKNVEISSFAELADIEGNSIVTIGFPMTVVYADAENMMLLVYANGEYSLLTRMYILEDEGITYEPGDVIPAGAVTRLSHNGSLIGDSHFLPATEVAEIPDPVKVADIQTIDTPYVYTLLEGVEVEANNWGDTYMVAGEFTMEFDFSSPAKVPTGKWNVLGFPMAGYFGDFNFFAISYTEAASGISAIAADCKDGRIYNMLGIDCGSDASTLAPGIYVINGKKFRK